MTFPLPTSTRLGIYAKVQVVGAFLPGALVLLGIWLIVKAPEKPLEAANAAVEGISSWVLASALGLGLLVAFACGVLCRTLAFFLFDRVPLHLPELWNGERVRQELDGTFGSASVGAALSRHPALEHALQSREQRRDSARERRGEILAYSKLWLRETQPVLAVDEFEYEINLFVAIALPVLLAPLALVRVMSWGYWAATVGVLIGTGLAWLLWQRARAAQQAELVDAVRNLMLAEWFGDADQSAKNRGSP